MTQKCAKCGMPIAPGFKFCNGCGNLVPEEKKAHDGAVPYSDYVGCHGRAIRILTGRTAGTFYAAYPSCTIGRENCDIRILHDQTLSPQHVRLSTYSEDTILEDNDSLNGIFLRMRDPRILLNNEIIRAGDHYFLYQIISVERFNESHQTEFYASPLHGERFRIVEILKEGRRGRALTATEAGLAVGRTDGDFQFAEDDKMSDRHFEIRWTQQGGMIFDYSFNGTYLKIREPTRVAEGDTFFAGNTLFRVI
ncbi:MAG: FHA domain-containing protein [Proteobacteria bacterium]|nr:FHA domain-containing protein [Pseudomonadota bacterium]